MHKRYAGGLLVVGGLALIVTGLLRGEAHLVLIRAVIICLECIGLR